MKMNINKCLVALILVVAAVLGGCSFVHYSFSGTSIQAEVKTVTINYFEYKALKVNPNLSNDLTEAMRDKFRKLTKLEQVEMDGDLELQGEITGYEVRAAAVTANEVAAQNRLTVTVKLKFTNRKYPEDDFEKDFSAYSDYDSTNALDAVESTLCQEIIDKLVEDMFNASVAQVVSAELYLLALADAVAVGHGWQPGRHYPSPPNTMNFSSASSCMGVIFSGTGACCTVKSSSTCVMPSALRSLWYPAAASASR